MASRSQTAQKAFDIANPIVSDLGYELIDVEYKKEGSRFILRLFIDRRGGVSTDDCETVSKAVDPIFDQQLGTVPDYLEVSSPGLTRPLVSTADFLRHLGEEVEVKLYSTFEDQKLFTGAIVNADDGFLILSVGDRNIPFKTESIASVKRTIRF